MGDIPTGGLMILVAGPFRSGTNGDPALIQANVGAMTGVSLELYRRGHLPVMGEWFALPLIERAAADGDQGACEEMFHPIAEQVLARCDACLRIGGSSDGADRMVRRARELGKTVYLNLEDVPLTAQRCAVIARPPRRLFLQPEQRATERGQAATKGGFDRRLSLDAEQRTEERSKTAHMHPDGARRTSLVPPRETSARGAVQ
jgi:hypothetical protein